MKKEISSKEVLAGDSEKEKINNLTLTQEGNMEKAKESEGKGNGAVDMELDTIDINSMTVSEDYCRIDSDDNSSLDESFEREDMLEPPHVYKNEQGGYTIVDGVRRFKAALKKGWTKVLCLIIYGLTQAGAAHLSYRKNVERKTLSIIEVARHIRNMKGKYGYTVRELETMGYGPHSSISSKLQLLDLPEEVQIKIHKDEITVAHGLALLKLPSQEEQKNLATQIGKEDMSVNSTKRYVDRFLAKKDLSKEDNAKESVTSDNDIPGVVRFRKSRGMSELQDNSVPLIVTNTIPFDNAQNSYGSFKAHSAEIEGFAKEGVRVVGPGGIIVLITDYINYAGRDGSVIKLMRPIYQNSLQKHGASLTDMIIWVVPSSLGKRNIRPNAADQPHTSYRINNNCVHIDIYRVKGERELPSEEIISQSKLTKEQKTAWIGGNGLWKIGMEEMFNRLIRIYSYVGDTVLDPFLGDGTMLKVAKELGRVGIGYEEDLRKKSAIMENLGLVPEEVAVKSSKLMSAYVKQTMPTEDKAVKSSEPEAEFFRRKAQPDEADEEVAEEETVS